MVVSAFSCFSCAGASPVCLPVPRLMFGLVTDIFFVFKLKGSLVMISCKWTGVIWACFSPKFRQNQTAEAQECRTFRFGLCILCSNTHLYILSHCPSFFLSVCFPALRCKEECAAGSYGQDCKGVCDCANGARCYNIDGACLCEPGFSGPHCRDRMCPDGIYGMHCERTCLCQDKHTLR